ncbi:MAG: aminodeoxychorismate lyase [Spirochaetia bacterium]|nr:aminodeoxychorismate lyase [Spirochaetia bacterium]
MKKNPVKYLVNGIPNAEIFPFDRGLHYGEGIFESMYAAGKSIPFLDEHLNRLMKGCRALNFPEPERTILQKEIKSLLSEENSVIKILLTGGDSGRGYLSPEKPDIRRILFRYKAPKNRKIYQDNGVKLAFLKRTLSCPENLNNIKHTSRLEHVLARNEIRDAEIYDGILSDKNGFIVETTSSNLFWITQGTLFTPDLKTCGLKGILRNFILKTANEEKIFLQEGAFRQKDLLGADEIFITNAVMGILPVSAVDAQEYSKREITRRLQSHLNKRMGD